MVPWETARTQDGEVLIVELPVVADAASDNAKPERP